MANKISLVFEAIGADKLAQVFGQVASGAEKAGASAEKAAKGTESAGQAAGAATKNVDLLGLSLGKMSGLAGQAGVDLSVFQKAIQGAHESMGMLAGGFSAGTVVVGTFVTGIAAMTGVLIAASQHLVSSYNEIKTFSAISGMAATDADDLADAMSAVGVSSQQLSMALFKLEDDASTGGEALLKLGITMDELKTKSSGELFVATIDKIQALGSQSEKTAALVEVFGARLGRAFAELVREGGASIDELKAKVADLSPWTKEMEENARNLAVAQGFLQNAIGGVVDMLGNAFAPILTTAINAMTDWVVSLRKGVEESGVLGTTINMLVDVFASLWEAIAPLMPLIKELGIATVQVGLAMLSAFQGVMIPVVALTGAIGALWAAIQKMASGDFAGALTALKTGLAETEAAVGRQIARFNEQVLANEKLSDSLHGVSTSWDDLTSYTTEAGAAAERTAPSIRKIGDETKKASDEVKQAAEALKQWEKAVGQVGITAALIADDVEKLRSALEFEDLEATIRGLEGINKTFVDLQKGIDAVHMTEVQKELAAFAAELAKIPGLGEPAQQALLDVAAGMLRIRDDAREGKKELQDAAKYMMDLGTAATTAKVPLSNLGGSLKDVTDDAADAGVQFAILTDNAKVLIPPQTVESVVQFGDAMRELKPTAADAAVTLDILNDRVSESGAASIEAEQRWQKFGDGLKGMFDSVGDTFGKITTGLIQGTLDIDDAFKNLGQSLLINFAQTVFDAILDEAQGFVDDFIDTIVEGLQNFDWGGFFSDLFSFIGGFFGGGGGGGGGGGDWFDDLDFYAHGGRVRRTGPAYLHEGEIVVPAGFGGGWRSPGFSAMPRSGGDRGTIPVHVQNVNQFGQQFGFWADKIIQATPLALQGIGMLTGSSALSGAGQGLGIMGALKTGWNMFTGGPNNPGSTWFGATPQGGPYNTGWSSQNMASIVSGLGSLMSMVGGFTGSKGLEYAGMGVQGAVLATQIASAIFPQLATAITNLGASIGASIGGSLGSAVASSAASFAGTAGAAAAAGGGLMGLTATVLGPAAVMAIPALAGFLANMGQAEKARQDIVRRQSGQVYGGEMAARAATVKTMADLDKKYTDAVFGERTPRQDVTMLATWAMVGAEQSNQAIMTMKRYAEEMGANVDDLTAMEQANIDKMNAFISTAAKIGVTPDMALLNIAPHTVSPGHGVTSPENFAALLDVWTEIINRLVNGTKDVEESTKGVDQATKSVVANQADLIMKYGGQVDMLRQISEELDLGIDIPNIMKLTKQQLDFLGTATGKQIEDMIKGWKTQITDAIVKDPVKLTAILPMEKFRKEGESLEQTTERVAASLHGLGLMMKMVDDEIASMKSSGLEMVTKNFTTTMKEIKTGLTEAVEQFEENAIRIDKSSGLIGDPTAMLEAAAVAHDLLIARYEAEIALIQQITMALDQLSQGANALAMTAARLQELGVLPTGGMDLVNFLSDALSTLFAKGMPGVQEALGPEARLTVGRGAVNVFATQAMMAARTMDLPGLEAAMKAAGNLVNGFTKTINEINLIKDPAERMRLLTAALEQVGAATEAAAQAAITYWTALHDTVQRMMDQLNSIASSIAAAGNTIAANAEWLKKAGIDVKAMGTDLLNLISLFPTMAAKIELLRSGIQTFLAGFSEKAMKDLEELAIRYKAATPGSPQQADFGAQITAALQPMLTALFNSFRAAMNLQDPGQRLAALTAIMDTIGKTLGGLPPGLADALTKIFGPEVKILVEAMQAAAKAQAEQAAKVADELKKIIDNKALSPENFLLLTVKGIQDSLKLITEGAAPLFKLIADGMVKAGGDINDAIKIAGKALADALGGFKDPATQLAAELKILNDTLYQKMKDAVIAGIDAALGTAQSGIDYVPKTGIYLLHPGEAVINPEESAAIRAGRGVYSAGGYMPASAGESAAPVHVTLAPVMHFAGVSRADAEAIAKTVIARMTDSAKTGELGVIIERRARGRV